MNQIKSFFKRSKSYPTYNKPAKVIDDKSVLNLRAHYCSTCEEMIFKTLKKCVYCEKKSICIFCYKGDQICKECNDELIKLYNFIEKPFKKLSNSIKDNVEQLL